MSSRGGGLHCLDLAVCGACRQLTRDLKRLADAREDAADHREALTVKRERAEPLARLRG